MNNIIIFSVFQSDKTEDTNYMNTINVEKLLKRSNIDFKPVYGVYKGKEVESIIIDLKYLNVALEIAIQYNQESVLIVQNGLGTLKYLPTTLQEDTVLGYFTEVTKDQAKSLDDHTWDQETDKYYGCLTDRRENQRISLNTKTWGINNA